MSLHSPTRVPVDDSYAVLVGKAVYVFAYYEWEIIWIMETIRAGFVGKYCRESSLTSGQVKSEFQKIIDYSTTDFSKLSKQELQKCCDEFEGLISKRNALIHAHPCTDTDGSQILAYQTKTTKPIPDMKWPREEVEKAIEEFDKAAISAGALLDRVR